MLIGIDLNVICSFSADGGSEMLGLIKPGAADFINSVKDNYKIAICSGLVSNLDGVVILSEYLEVNDIHHDELFESSKGTDIYISSKTLQFDGDFNNLKYALLRYRKNVNKNYALSPGDYGKLYYRLSLFPKGTTLSILKEYGYHPIIKNKLVLVEFALNVLPTEAWNSIWKKEFRVTPGSNHEMFAEAWNSVKPKKSRRQKIYEGY
jgi:hypothetical protein